MWFGVQNVTPRSSILHHVFNRLLELNARWAGVVVKLIGWWILILSLLILLFFTLSGIRGLLATIPPIIQFACVFLVVLAIALAIMMLRERGRAVDACQYFLNAFSSLHAATSDEKAYGIGAEKMSEIRRKGNLLRGKAKDWWQSLDESFECYTSPDGQQGWFLTRPAAESLPEDEVVSTFYHASFHQAVPGILTALGLLATFVAILLALAGVTYDAQDLAHPVSGIDNLINGLSGKFLSSIIALILGVLFTFVEKKICERQILAAYNDLIKRCKQVFPYLSQSRILLDIQRLALQARIESEMKVSERL
jgi:hypothetical protein